MATLPKPGRRKDNEYLAGSMASNREMIMLVNRLITRLKQDDLSMHELSLLLIQMANQLAMQSHHLHEMDKIRLNFAHKSPATQTNGQRRKSKSNTEDTEQN